MLSMNIEELRDYILSKPHGTEDMPFGPDVLVFRVGGKMFALTGLDQNPPEVNLKCNPELALELREEHHWILPGYHMNKKHWNTLVLYDTVPVRLVKELIDHSYELVLASLSKKERLELINQ